MSNITTSNSEVMDLFLEEIHSLDRHLITVNYKDLVEVFVGLGLPVGQVRAALAERREVLRREAVLKGFQKTFAAAADTSSFASEIIKGNLRNVGIRLRENIENPTEETANRLFRQIEALQGISFSGSSWLNMVDTFEIYQTLLEWVEDHDNEVIKLLI